MKVKIILSVLLFTVLMSCGHVKKREIEKMNECYKAKLGFWGNEVDYTNAYAQFIDSFPKLQTREKILQYREFMIDKAIFFNTDRNKLLAVILQKSKGGRDYFGFGRVVRGFKNDKGEWSFELDREYLFDKNWYKLYEENSFENLSKISRYYVIIEGGTRSSRCDIDENYWFGSE